MFHFDTVETFFKAHQYTSQALGAVATLAAVVLSLWLSRKEPEKLSASVSVSVIVGAGVKYDDVITVHIKNIGQRVVFIPEFFFSFRIPFSKIAYALKPQNSGTIQLVPGRSQTIQLITLPAFQSEFRRCFGEINPLFRSMRLKYIKGYIATESGGDHRVKLSTPFKKQVSILKKGLNKKPRQ